MIRTRPLLPLLLACTLLSLTSCQRVQPVRTLPSWVGGIYIPMIENKSTEMGIEEVVTRLTQEEFLADGRLDIVPKAGADLELAATILSYRVSVGETDSDDIMETGRINIQSTVLLFDPYNPEEPLASLGPIETVYFYNSDPRSTGYDIEPDVKEKVFTQLARQIVNITIHGFPTSISTLPEGARIPIAPQTGTHGRSFGASD